MKNIRLMLCVVLTSSLAASAAVIEQWDMNGNGQWQNSLTTGLNLGGHYNTNNHTLAQTDDDGTFLFAPASLPQGFGGKTPLTAPIDLTQGVVTLSFAFTGVDWSGNPTVNNNIAFRLYESDAADAEYVGVQILDGFSTDRLRSRWDNSAAFGGTGSTFGRYGADLTASGNYSVVLEIDYANNEIRLSGAQDWDPVANGSGVLTNSVDFAAAGFTTIANFQTRYANWSAGDTMLVDDITISQIPEPATVGLVAIMGGSLLFIRRRFRMD